MSDFGSANWSETDASNNAAVPNGFPEGMNPSDVNNAARANMGAEKRFWNRINSVKTTAGTSTVYTLTYDVAAASYYDGELFSFIVDETCGAAPTLNINGLGARNLRKFTAGAFANLAAGDIVTNQPITVRYNLAATTFDLIPTLVTDAPTQAVGNSSTLVATTAFVQAATAKVYIQTFTGSGTYTPHAGMVNCIIEAVGGGGGGSGIAAASASVAAGGGGAGSRSIKIATAADIGASQTVTIGAAGAAGSAGNNSGGNGGDTSLGALCIGKGGTGGVNIGAGFTGAGGAGGVAGTGTVTATGESGFTGMAGASIATVVPTGGAGGSSPYGGGGIGPSPTSAATAGGAATGYGSGGAGAAANNSGAGTAAGGVGTAGLVIITEYCNQ